MRRREVLYLLVQMAFRNLVNHRGKTLIVGSILFFGTFLWTVGSSLVGSIEKAMAGSLVNSVIGHLQIYHAETRDNLALFGGGTLGAPDIGEIPDFSRVLQATQGVPNIAAIVPMGATVAMLSNPSRLDQALAGLRASVRAKDTKAQNKQARRVRFLVERLLTETESRLQGQPPTPDVARNLDDLQRALSPAFWGDFARHPLEQLEFLDTRIAPLGAAGNLIYMRILGTDLDHYRQVFDRFMMVEGTPVPPGQRGMLMPARFREMIKNKVARELDAMHRKIVEEGLTFRTDEALREQAERNARQYKRILTDLDPDKEQEVLTAVRNEIGKPLASLDEAIQEFLTVNDDNFLRRYRLFYERIAPHIDLYPVKVGDTVTLRAFTRSGYMKGANLKLYGIFTFKGMETSDLAGVYNLIDIMTLRELYGAVTTDQKAELEAIRREIGVREVSRENVEAALFGAVDDLVSETLPSTANRTEPLSRVASAPTQPDDVRFTREDVEHGLALHAAVLLKDASKLRDTQQDLERAFKRAGLPLRVVDWQSAAGFVGQLTLAMRAVLLFGMVIIFLVVLVVVNNTVIISTLERTNEIGTLRAMGAQRPFVLWMFLFEIAAIALVAGIAGVLAGAGLITGLGVGGIPAPSPKVNFLFGGPRLFPVLAAADMLVGLAIILLVSIAATFPARAATRVQPIEAMRGAE